jgi:surface antigen
MRRRSMLMRRVGTGLAGALVCLLAGSVLVPSATASTTVSCNGSGNSCLPGIGDDYPYKNAVMDGGFGYGGYYRECTDFVAWRLNRDGAPGWYAWGNASSWDDTARSKGVRVDRTPALGAVAQWESNHVAYVAGWNADHSQIFIEEYNRDFNGTYGSRWISAASPSNFLHVHDLVASDPIGAFDSATSSAPGTVHVAGWAFDPDAPTTPIRVHVYVGGPAGSGAPGFDIGTTSVTRPDVKAVYPQAGYLTGFDATVSGDFSGSLTIYMYAINVGAGSNALVSQRVTTIANPRPLGSFDETTSPAPGKVRVRGWTFDPNSPTTPIRVHVYVGGPAGSGAPGFDIGATSVARPDVKAVYPQAGNLTGFDATVSIPGGGRLDVFVYAINTGPGSNVLIGSRAVSVTTAPPIPVLTSAPVISGPTRVTGTLTCTASYSGATNLTYRWARDGHVLVETQPTYRLSAADFGTTLTCTTRASNPSGTTSFTSSSPTARISLGPALVNTTAPAWKGKSRVGKTVRITTAGSWAPAAVSTTVQWLRNGKSIKGATHTRYTLARKDKGKFISVRITAHRHGYGPGATVSRRERV